MSKKCIDHIGQEIVVGDWAAVTQNNVIHVGKVIKASSTVTIAINSREEFMLTNKPFLKLKSWKDKRDFLEKKYGKHNSYWRTLSPSWARGGKFIKITPTNKMIIDYDKKQ